MSYEKKEKKYRPSLEDIARRSFKDVGSGLRNAAVEFKDFLVSESFRQDLKDLGQGLLSAGGFLHAIPTAYRFGKEHKVVEEGCPGCGCAIGAGAAFLQYIVYFAIATDGGHPEYLWFPVAGNILSGIYEISRRATLKLIEEEKKKLKLNPDKNPYSKEEKE